MVVEAQLVHVPQKPSEKGPPPHESMQLAKWGIGAKAGYQLVPNVLFRAQKHLGIDCIDVVILLNLSLHWWGPFNLPYPSSQLLAQRTNLSKRTVERHLHNLEKKGFIKRQQPNAQEGKPKTRSFDMSGLVEKLEAAASLNLVQRYFAKELKQKREFAG
jgi:predicted transcriptional regulator